MSDKIQVTIQIEREALKSILDILEEPNQCYPSSETATDFFEVHWDMLESLGSEARRIGLKSSWDEEGEDEEEDACYDCGAPLTLSGRCPDCEEEEEQEAIDEMKADTGPDLCDSCLAPVDDCTCEKEESCDIAP